MEAITDFAVEIGAMAHHVFFLVPTGRAVKIEEEALRVVAYEKTMARLMEKQKQVSIEIKPTCAPQFIRVADKKGIPLRFSKGCLAGISYCIISPVGNVQPCAYLDMPLGNVREKPFRSYLARKRSPAKACVLWIIRANAEYVITRAAAAVVEPELIITMATIWRRIPGVFTIPGEMFKVRGWDETDRKLVRYAAKRFSPGSTALTWRWLERLGIEEDEVLARLSRHEAGGIDQAVGGDNGLPQDWVLFYPVCSAGSGG